MVIGYMGLSSNSIRTQTLQEEEEQQQQQEVENCLSYVGTL